MQSIKRSPTTIDPPITIHATYLGVRARAGEGVGGHPEALELDALHLHVLVKVIEVDGCCVCSIY